MGTENQRYYHPRVEERKPLQDHCGVVGILPPTNQPIFETGYHGLITLQTRGNGGAGVALLNHEGIKIHKSQGLICEVFPPSIRDGLADVTANIGVFQTRYATCGDESAVQPIVGENHNGRFIVAHNGQFSSQPDQDPRKSDTQIFAEALADSTEPNWDEAIIKTLSEAKGAWSLIIATENGESNSMYLARDPYGIRPLSYTQIDGVWIAASETAALDSMGATRYTEVLPGEIIKISENGSTILQQASNGPKFSCSFENIYFGDGNSRAHLPRTSRYEINTNLTTDEVRKRSGIIMARNHPEDRNIHADFVTGVPGTGIPGGQAYAEELGVKYEQAFWDLTPPDQERRTFITANIDTIPAMFDGHFGYDEKLLRGKVIILVDDSIVRGNASRALIKYLKEKIGVRETHMRSLSPPIEHCCHLGINTNDPQELIFVRCDRKTELVRRTIGADSLTYLTRRELREAMTGNPNAKGFCFGCMGEQPPIDKYGRINNGFT